MNEFKIKKYKYLFFIVFIIFFGECLAIRATTDNDSVYVWHFSNENNQKDKLLAEKLTSSFETELVSEGCFTVLQRRDISKLIEHAKQEKAISRIDDISASNQEVLQSKKADMVVFGQLYDGENNLKVSVKFIDINNREIRYTGKIYIQKNSLNNLESTDEEIKKLVKQIKICKKDENVPPKVGTTGEVIDWGEKKSISDIKERTSTSENSGVPPVKSQEQKKIDGDVSEIRVSTDNEAERELEKTGWND